MERIDTNTGRIYVDREKYLEFLSVGDYGKSNNIKANFLNLTNEIHKVENKPVDLSEKWVATISTQKGCSMNCRFCDCSSLKFLKNVSSNELGYQISTILNDYKETCNYTKRFNVHFARMGEPTFNRDILYFTTYELRKLVNSFIKADVVHPVLTTMLPKMSKKLDLKDYLNSWCFIKNVMYKGEAGLQLSINSTSDEQRAWLFRDRSVSLSYISKLADKLPTPVGRKYTLNFPVTKDAILDAKVLSQLFDKDKFIVKITPIHETKQAILNGLDTHEGYLSYDVYRQFEDPLLEEGWDVIVFVPSLEEDSDRITCGNALILGESR